MISIPRVLPFHSHMLKTYGRTFFMWRGPTPVINIMDPEQIKEVYDGDKWAKHRRIINPAFHLEKIKNMVPAFHQSCSEVVGEWDKLVSEKGSSREVDVWPGLVGMTADVISRTAFGSSYKEGQRIFELQSELSQLIILSFQGAFIPGYRYLPTKNNRRMRAADREIQVILRGIITKRLEAREAGEAPSDDLLGTLLESNLGQAKGHGMSIEDVMEECKLFYFAGQETTSVLLNWTMVLLSQHQDWQTRARDEVKQVFGDREPDTDGLNQLKVAISSSGTADQSHSQRDEARRPDATGRRSDKSTYSAVQRDTELWGNDAAEFKPRDSKTVSQRQQRAKSLSFPLRGDQGSALDRTFAMLEAKMAMALILQRFSLELSPSMFMRLTQSYHSPTVWCSSYHTQDITP
ncbi:unnamed protein product [Microthlaspi erraticum]|uniref:Cytochrome P450 n=1 Tax=Microthlaspi erraticum TaxID=1685480 RepID=A0A6D2IG52_9BRAS|nr:unnamed protein product [Microthlaspi erraticum]